MSATGTYRTLAAGSMMSANRGEADLVGRREEVCENDPKPTLGR